MTSTLTARQRSFLRSAGRRISPQVNLGKGGLSTGALAHVRDLLSRGELVKVRLLEAATEDRFAAAEALAEAVGAALVDVIGRAVVLYKPNDDLPADKRLQLPAP